MSFTFRNNLIQIIHNTQKCLKSNNVARNNILKYSSNSGTIFQYERDPAQDFLNAETQRLLKSITQIQTEKVFRKRSVSDNAVDYKFMTTEQLEKAFKEIAEKAESYLQMPPVVLIKDDVHKILSKDPALKDFSHTKYVISDITYGLKQSERKIVIRHTNGTLEHAPMSIRKRINQTYFPLFGRKLFMPRIFEEENLKRCLDEHKYEFILDRVCIQYEPYEKEFHEISFRVYTHLNETKFFDSLRSTRHFGPMSFFFAWHRIIDDLLFDMIKKEYLKNGVELISLMYNLNKIDYDKTILQKVEELLHSGGILNDLRKQISVQTSDDIHEKIKQAIGKNDNDFIADDICLKFIENYIDTKALKKVPLKLAIQTFRESNDEKKKLYNGLCKAHGVI